MSRRRNLSMTYNINGMNQSQGLGGGSDRDHASSRVSSNRIKPKQSIIELKETMNYIKYEWPQVIKEGSNPIELAISLLDDSSVGLSHKLPEFEEISDNTANALRKVVNDYHEVFNNSIGSYHYLLTSSKNNQRDANDIKHMLESTTKEIHDHTDYLQDLNQTSIRYSEMIEILDAIESLNLIPEKIDQLIVDKKIHQVYDIINQGYNTAEKYNLWNLACMNSIKNYLELQSNNLFDMIIDELTNELYLKTPIINQNEIWELFQSSSNSKLINLKNFLLKLNNLEEFIYNSANLDVDEIGETFNELFNEFIYKQLPKLFHNQNNSMDLNLLMDISGDFQKFNYIYQLLNTLLKLNRLNPAIEILLQSNQQEFHGLLYRIIEEIKQTNMTELTKLNKLVNYDLNNQFELSFEFELNNLNDYSIKILKHLFSNIFFKSLLVLQRQSLVQEIIHMFNLNMTYDIHKIWNNIKTELSMFMVSYIGETLRHDYVENPDKPMINQLFKFDQISFNDDDILMHFPNLNNTDNSDNSKSNPNPHNNHHNSNDQFDLDDGSNSKLFIKSETLHSNLEVLVPVNTFNMRIILEFFLIFISSSDKLFNHHNNNNNNKKIIDQKKSNNTNTNTKPHNKLSMQFFDSFMRITFLPKLKDNFNNKFNQIIGNHEDETINGFKVNLIQLNDNVQIYQNSQEFKKFFLNICQILNTSLIYRSDLNDLVLQYLQKFLMGYLQFYNQLTGGGNNLKLNYWLKIPALQEISKTIMINDLNEMTNELPNGSFNHQESEANNESNLKSQIDQEISIMLQDDKFLDINKDDLLDEDVINELSNLIVTINWILSWLPRVCKESNYKYEEVSEIDRLKYDWNFLENGKKHIDIDDSNNNISSGYNIDIISDPHSNNNNNAITTAATSSNNNNNNNNNHSKQSHDEKIYLSLNNENFVKFKDMINQFKLLKLNCLTNLRYDLRLRANYYIISSYKYENWMLNNEPGNSDQFILKFNKEFFTIDSKFNESFNQQEIFTILKGISSYLNELIIQGTKIIRKINKFGIKKILINIFTVQQMLKNIQKNIIINFERSSYYFNLFLINENQLIEKLDKFNKFEKINLIRLLYSEKLADGQGSSLVTSKYNDLLSKVNR